MEANGPVNMTNSSGVTDREIIGALVHLHRGELARMTSYRMRLDTTTNWAVGTTAAIATFALSSNQLPHFALAMSFGLNLIFLWMEARRFRGYELIRQRVRLLERGFYASLLKRDLRGNWEVALTESLETPIMPITYLQAVSVRLRRNYIWLIVIVYVAWLIKLDLVGELPAAAKMGPISGTSALGLSIVVFLSLTLLATIYHPPEEG
jgi:uncharacterized membrane protein